MCCCLYVFAKWLWQFIITKCRDDFFFHIYLFSYNISKHSLIHWHTCVDSHTTTNNYYTVFNIIIIFAGGSYFFHFVAMRILIQHHHISLLDIHLVPIIANVSLSFAYAIRFNVYVLKFIYVFSTQLSNWQSLFCLLILESVCFILSTFALKCSRKRQTECIAVNGAFCESVKAR